MRVILLKDTLRPELKNMLSRLRQRTTLMIAIGQQAVSYAKDAFTDPSLRPSPWPAKKDGTKATLYKSGTLKQSPRLVSAREDYVIVGSDRLYAAIHQLGGKTKPHVIKPKDAAALHFNIGAQGYFAKQVNHPGSIIPARPFFPINDDGTLLPEFEADINEMVERHIGMDK